MRKPLVVSAKVLGGVTAAVALFVIAVMATVLMLGLRDVYADETVIEKRVQENRTTVEVVPAPKARVIEEHTVEAVQAPAVIEKRTTVEAVPPPAVVEKRTTVETVPAPAVIEKRTIEKRVEEDD